MWKEKTLGPQYRGAFQRGKNLATSPLTLVHSTLLHELSLWGRLRGNVAKLQAVLHNSLLLKLQNFSLVFLEVKLDNFLTREGIIQELLLWLIHELIRLYASQRMAQDVQQHVYSATLSCCNQNIVDGPLISGFDSDSSGSFDAFKKPRSQFIWCPVSIGCRGPGADLLRLVVVQQECRRGGQLSSPATWPIS
jgi:hypothetical protein